MKARTFNAAGDIEITLDPGEKLATYMNPKDSGQSMVFTILKAFPGAEIDAYNAYLKDGTLAASPSTPGPFPPDLFAYAKEARDTHENGGITVQGVPVSTDDRSKTLVLGARARAEADATLVTSWAAADGHVYPLTSAQIIAVSDAIGAFVAELFEEYAKVMADVSAGTITTTAQIDARYGALNVAF